MDVERPHLHWKVQHVWKFNHCNIINVIVSVFNWFLINVAYDTLIIAADVFDMVSRLIPSCVAVFGLAKVFLLPQ